MKSHKSSAVKTENGIENSANVLNKALLPQVINCKTEKGQELFVSIKKRALKYH